MKLFLSKFLPHFFYPLGLFYLLLLIALLQEFSWNGRTALLLAALLIL